LSKVKAAPAGPVFNTLDRAARRKGFNVQGVIHEGSRRRGAASTDRRDAIPDQGELAALSAEICAQSAVIAEMDHRIKNHLQLLASYARNLARAPNETAAHLASEIAARLSMVAAVHESLHLTRHGQPPAAASFLWKVCASLQDGEHTVTVDCGSQVTLQPDELAPTGMILTEAICNSLKHGFPLGRVGAVHVTFHEISGRRVLEICDNGTGFPAGISPPGGSGLRLIAAFAKRLRSELVFESRPGRGVCVRVTFPAG
jgi:two-component sensor histidine kinase